MKLSLLPFLPVLLGAFLIPAIVLQTACTSSLSGEAAAFALIESGVDALVSDLAVTGTIPEADATEVQNVVNASITAETATTEELASTDTTAVKSAKIATYWAPVLSQVTQLPQTVQVILDTLVSAINDYLKIVAPTGSAAAADGSLIVPTADGKVILPAHISLNRLSKAERLAHVGSQHSKMTKLFGSR